MTNLSRDRARPLEVDKVERGTLKLTAGRETR